MLKKGEISERNLDLLSIPKTFWWDHWLINGFPDDGHVGSTV